ncbi:hypothetical protein [Streptomyces sp. ATMOS53]
MTDNRSVPRSHAEKIVVDGETEAVVVELGAWGSNTRARRDKLSAEQLAALAELGVDWAGATPKQATQSDPVPTDGGPAQPMPPEVPAQGPHVPHADTLTDEEHEAEAARGRAHMQRLTELMRKRTKAELLRMAYAGGLVNHNSPEKWRKDEIASTVVDTELRTADQRAPARPAAVTARPVPVKPLPQQDHHDECDKSVYEGGTCTCTCDLIEQYGPPSERDDY